MGKGDPIAMVLAYHQALEDRHSADADFDWVRGYAASIDHGLSLAIARRDGKPVGKVTRVTRDANQEVAVMESDYRY